MPSLNVNWLSELPILLLELELLLREEVVDLTVPSELVLEAELVDASLLLVPRARFDPFDKAAPDVAELFRPLLHVALTLPPLVSVRDRLCV